MLTFILYKRSHFRACDYYNIIVKETQNKFLLVGNEKELQKYTFVTKLSRDINAYH